VPYKAIRHRIDARVRKETERLEEEGLDKPQEEGDDSHDEAADRLVW
jgi:hypothetical protein